MRRAQKAPLSGAHARAIRTAWPPLRSRPWLSDLSLLGLRFGREPVEEVLVEVVGAFLVEEVADAVPDHDGAAELDLERYSRRIARDDERRALAARKKHVDGRTPHPGRLPAGEIGVRGGRSTRL